MVDLHSDLLLGVDIRPGSAGDAQTLVDSVLQAQINLDAARVPAEIIEVAADKGYHSAGALELSDDLGLRTYIPEPRRTHPVREHVAPITLGQVVVTW